MPITMYPTLQAFYEENHEGRLHSPEAGYAVHQSLTSHAEAQLAMSYGPLFVLGTVPPDPVPDIRSVYYATLDRILDGWTDHCGPKNGLTWIRDCIEADTAARLRETSP